MTYFYYRTPTSLYDTMYLFTQSFEALTEAEKTNLGDCVLWHSELPFSGYPVVEDGVLRTATVTELVEAGIIVLSTKEALVDGAIYTLSSSEMKDDDGSVVAKPIVEPTTEMLATQVRTERDNRITSCDWIISRHAEQVALGVDTILTAEEYAAWLAYRQALRDLPNVEGFPWDGGGAETPWPVEV